MPFPVRCSCFTFFISRTIIRNGSIISLLQFGNMKQYSTSTHRIGMAGSGSLSSDEARRLVSVLSDEERLRLSRAISDVTSYQTDHEVERPANRQLRLVLIEAALPFVGFGFLDNAVMIVAGEYIDITIGVTLGISTMAAAAFGNLISDLSGLGLADSVEALCRRLGLPNPMLTPSQVRHNSVRWMQRIGRVIGVTIGCLLGMCPLFWFDQEPHSDSKSEDSNNSNNNNTSA